MNKDKETKKYSIRKKKELEIIKVFLYKAYGGDMLSIHIYDKITKKVYAGNIGISSWKKEEIEYPST